MSVVLFTLAKAALRLALSWLADAVSKPPAVNYLSTICNVCGAFHIDRGSRPHGSILPGSDIVQATSYQLPAVSYQQTVMSVVLFTMAEAAVHLVLFLLAVTRLPTVSCQQTVKSVGRFTMAEAAVYLALFLLAVTIFRLPA
jgi:hypothetical protein